MPGPQAQRQLDDIAALAADQGAPDFKLREVTKNLYIGDMSVVMNPHLMRKATHVLCCDARATAVLHQVSRSRGQETAIIDLGTVTQQREAAKEVEMGVAFVDNALRKGVCVCYCLDGVSASSTVAAAFLMFKGDTYATASYMVRLANPQASPGAQWGRHLTKWNEGFTQKRIEQVKRARGFISGDPLPASAMRIKRAGPKPSDQPPADLDGDSKFKRSSSKYSSKGSDAADYCGDDDEEDVKKSDPVTVMLSRFITLLGLILNIVLTAWMNYDGFRAEGMCAIYACHPKCNPNFIPPQEYVATDSNGTNGTGAAATPAGPVGPSLLRSELPQWARPRRQPRSMVSRLLVSDCLDFEDEEDDDGIKGNSTSDGANAGFEGDGSGTGSAATPNSGGSGSEADPATLLGLHSHLGLGLEANESLLLGLGPANESESVDVGNASESLANASKSVTRQEESAKNHNYMLIAELSWVSLILISIPYVLNWWRFCLMALQVVPSYALDLYGNPVSKSEQTQSQLKYVAFFFWFGFPIALFSDILLFTCYFCTMPEDLEHTKLWYRGYVAQFERVRTITEVLGLCIPHLIIYLLLTGSVISIGMDASPISVPPFLFMIGALLNAINMCKGFYSIAFFTRSEL